MWLQVSDEDNGKYTLLAVNTAGEAKADSLLDVMGKPKPPKVVKEIEPAELTIPGKKDLKLNCKIAGFPAPTIKWYRDGNEIKVSAIWQLFGSSKINASIIFIGTMFAHRPMVFSIT